MRFFTLIFSIQAWEATSTQVVFIGHYQNNAFYTFTQDAEKLSKELVNNNV